MQPAATIQPIQMPDDPVCLALAAAAAETLSDHLNLARWRAADGKAGYHFLRAGEAWAELQTLMAGLTAPVEAEAQQVSA